MIDLHTLVLWNGVALAVLGAVFLLYWIWLARAGELFWWCLPFLFGLMAAIAAFGRDLLPAVLGPRPTIMFVMLAYGAVWQAAREFHGKPLRVVPVAGVVGLWLAGSLLAGSVWGYPDVVARGAVLAAFNALAAREFWRGRRREPLPSRIAVVSILGANALFQGASHLFAPVLPAPLGTGPAEAWAVIGYNLMVLFVALSVTMLVISLSRERVAEAYHRLAIHDPLTGLLNRLTFDADAEQDDAGRRGPCALLVLDIDHFKKINDGFGHHVGDAVIVQAARTIEAAMRRSDRLYRFGGEEFVCLLPATGLAQAEAVAERVRRAFAEKVTIVPEGEVRATFSIGVAARVDGQTPRATLLANADAALYIAKRAGRNRVVASTLGIAPAPGGAGEGSPLAADRA